ncbi:MAG: TPM domain-containing protein [Thermoleophilia bacterium]|nr:TPM domain-containing protein [Thermoleophilia bacterium]
MRFALAAFLLLSLVGCTSPHPAAYDTNIAVPKGDPPFPNLDRFWVIDTASVLSQASIDENDAICQKLQDDRIAEVVVVVVTGVKHPDEWATHYGRWLKLGSSGMSTEGGNNGVVWLIRPDADERVTVSVGRGLPKFATVDYGKIMTDARDYLNFGNFDRAVSVIVTETDKRLRELYGSKSHPTGRTR